MTILVIAANNLRRLVRVRENLFFFFVLPLLLIVVLGLTSAGFEPRIGVYVMGERTTSVEGLIDGLEAVDGTKTTVFDDLGEATDQLEREDVTALVVVPADYGEALDSGATTELQYLSIPTSGGFEVQGFVQSVVAEQNATIRATRLVSDQTGLSENEAAALVAATERVVPELGATTVDAEGNPFVETDAVGFVAAQELVLFVFLMGMIAAAALIQVRKLGVTRRMLATPASTFEVVLGEALGRYGVALVQSAFIILATLVLFGLDWGSWPATLAIVAAFARVATAVALFIGALVSNVNQSSTLAHITPHAWAVDAFTEVIQRGGGLAQIGTELAVLVTYGVILLIAGAFTLRRAIVG